MDPSGYPTVDGINSLETILGKLGNPLCEELDIGGGGIVIDWFPGIERLRRYVLEGTKTKGMFGSSP
jgi:hypothetical protein